MSHKIAKAKRKAQNNRATPQDMHLILADYRRRANRADAHKLKEERYAHSRSAKSKLKGKVRKATRVLKGEKEPVSIFDFLTTQP